ncbi:MAG: hypothetical protein HYW97_00055 [Candidatus Wildermuthbacteria bacterium]|nr:hypothetical protein [Candidatus Wildermuthbacteria bacterium]
MWKVAEVEFRQVGENCATRDEAEQAAVQFRRKTRFYDPEEPPTYIVLIGPNGELEPLKQREVKRGN